MIGCFLLALLEDLRDFLLGGTAKGPEAGTVPLWKQVQLEPWNR